MLVDPAGRVAVVEVPGELGDGVGVGADLLAEPGGGDRGRGEADDGAAVVGPGAGEGLHGGGLAGSGGCDRELHAGARRWPCRGRGAPGRC